MEARTRWLLMVYLDHCKTLSVKRNPPVRFSSVSAVITDPAGCALARSVWETCHES